MALSNEKSDACIASDNTSRSGTSTLLIALRLILLSAGLSLLLFGFSEYGEDLDCETCQYQNGSKRNTSETINLFRIELIGVVTFSSSHQDHTKKDNCQADQHPFVILFTEQSL